VKLMDVVPFIIQLVTITGPLMLLAYSVVYVGIQVVEAIQREGLLNRQELRKPGKFYD